jgi:2-methylisocitrate lyase-like PEP mutase family enzyme
MPERPRRRLRTMLAEPGIQVVPGVANALYAKLAEQAGFEAVFSTGAGIANTVLGVPDLGLTTMSEVVEMTRNIAAAVEIPVIADADTGYGNHLNVTRTVRELERAGVAALTLEDQVAPKKCGHFEGKQVVSIREMVEKLVAATTARSDPDLVIVARTDAIAVEGLERTLERARAYVAAGADVIFADAPATIEELEAIPAGVPGIPCLADMVEGGKTPLVPAAELERMGYKLVLYANLALRLAARAVAHGFETLRREGTSARLLDQMLTWEERQGLVGLPEWEDLDQRIARQAAEVEGARSARRVAAAEAEDSDGRGHR